MGKKGPKGGAPSDPVARMLGDRRRERGLSLAAVAEASDIASPAYVLQVENGQKVPSQPVATRLASALGLDVELLRAWARARSRGDLAGVLEAASTVGRLLELPEPQPVAVRPQPPTPAPRDEPRVEAASLLSVPVLPEGADPTGVPPPPAIETLRLDRRLLPPLPDGASLVAYRLSAHGARGSGDALHPGDCAVVACDPSPSVHDAPCAVKLGGRIEIARVTVRDGVAYLPGPDRANDSGGRGEDAPAPAVTVVGRVVLAFRRWL